MQHCTQELKGNIRVFCRVRPLVGSDALTQPTAVDQLVQFPSSGGPQRLPQLVDQLQLLLSILSRSPQLQYCSCPLLCCFV